MEEFDIRHNINNDSVIAFTSVKKMKTLGWLDSAKVSTYLLGDEKSSHTKHLGMIDLYNLTHNVQVPFMKDLFEDSAVLEVEEGQTITYDLPVDRREVICFTAEDTSKLYEKPGIDNGIFEVVLSQEFTKGDILTYDPQYGQQIIVSEEHETLREGENFRHYVTMMTNDKRKFFPNDKLIAGIQWMKIGHALSELGTTYSNINMVKNPGGSLTCEFILGSPRGVETFMTNKASRMRADGFTQTTMDTLEAVQEKLDVLGGKDREMFLVAKGRGTNINTNTMRVGTTLEYLMLMEIALMECYSLMFAKAAVVPTSNGLKRVNEGAWHQVRRGKIIKYGRPGGITIDHLREASSYLYKNLNIPPHERYVKFKGGWFATQNVEQIMRTESISQLSNLPAAMLGVDSQIGKPVFKGDLGALEMQRVAIKQVSIPGLGTVEVEYDPSMDYQPLADRFSAGTYGENHAHTSYSLVIWDAASNKNSNVTTKVKNANLVEGGNKRANIYYVKPEGGHLCYGYEQGRMADGAKMTDVVSSLKHMGKSMWAWSQSASLMLDTTRYVTIELDR